MPINFHDSSNKRTYTARNAEAGWLERISPYIAPAGKRILDLGCGGGIYSKVLAQAGAEHVTGMDFSAEMLEGAAEYCAGMPNLTFMQGSAWNTGLPGQFCDLLLERALIHHIAELAPCFKEAHRVLKPGGRFIIQDRTPEDCLLAGSPEHIRGYFFEKFPRLRELESRRRHSGEEVALQLRETGFQRVASFGFWETRKIFGSFPELQQDLLNRTGRSILHELSDPELHALVEYIHEQLAEGSGRIQEKDRWTVWIAQKM
ncbi:MULTISPECIES: class I SAM-dependent methyltransferase [unclassified Paenibacillus]|uniref:class I SAM-dependent methyltransferase n=1 Tax=unclassified Paenibacillus TaxID=185978 RepID=UPI0024049257|nr:MULTISPECIES: class I SAM-dependent methyltransferase [unclassified Paenibacillus]MDF9842112.1 ubiquinone/menaquinone biosynthesis C-methylase UbiE [Paenibacillus sp. PastF-2]MDF9848634.1 ubiquinone/menaquinone biosynthesis C-methylase UbiE [Paenibacillus sp. PastM-2]MDF9855203.1 ubiquinone/menaquinone biosynthesis C-methylase UbiE [Paenibacillus sp. PastF-1]MDH6480473.1 ubiquinone/menaquinone biosynthesis C-methylase UbiE [Paenibacillus sp. PastH-2]MDH6507901.1 ubiquinone/menaquinone biosy